MTFAQTLLRQLLEQGELKKALTDAFCIDVESSAESDEINLEGLVDRIREAQGYNLAQSQEENPYWVQRCPRLRLPDIDLATFTGIPEIIERLAAIFRSIVVDRFPKPYPITVEDLIRIATDQLAASEPEEFGRAYQRFIAFSILALEVERGVDIDTSLEHDWDPGTKVESFDLGKFHIPPNPIEPLDDPCGVDRPSECTMLWASESGFRIYIRNPYHLGDSRSDKPEYRSAYLNGSCSELAMSNAMAELRTVFESIVKSIHHSTMSHERGDDGNTSIVYLVRNDGRLILDTCLSAFWRTPATGETDILDRLHNAVLLLAAADRAGTDPIALALSFAAIEALVCERGEVGKQLREHVPTLLESNPMLRTAKRRNALYDLYDLRSGVLHGSNFSGSRKASSAVRKLAAGVVRAICVWKILQEKVRGETPTWKDLITEIVIASRKKQAVIPELPGLGELLPDKTFK